jgi:hypothetical protein
VVDAEEGDAEGEEDDGDVLAAEPISTKAAVQQVLTLGASAITVPVVLQANIEPAVRERWVARVLHVPVVLQANI